jgi:tetratricopeptide (TPR) repeat protein
MKTRVIGVILLLSASQGTGASRCFAKEKDSYIKRMQMGQLNYFNGNTDAALRNFRWAVYLNPESYEARLSLMNLYAQAKKMDEALEQCREAAKLRPKRSDIHLILSNLLRSKEQLDEASKEMQLAIECGADEAQCEQALALIHLQKGNNEDGLKHIDKALESQENLPDAHLIKAILQFKLGKKDECLKELDTALAQRPAFAEAHNTKGEILAADKKWDEAISEYEQALKADPKSLQAHMALGNIFLQTGGTDGRGDLDKVVQHFSKVRELSPLDRIDKNVLYGLAIAHERKGEIQEAAREFQNGLLVENDPISRGQIQMHLQNLRKGSMFDIGKIQSGNKSESTGMNSLFAPSSPMFDQSFANLIQIKQEDKKTESQTN